MIPGRLQPHDGRFLHSQHQKTRKDSLGRAAFIINFLETQRPIIDDILDTWRQPHEVIASLLLEELVMSGGTEKILPLVLLSPIERTAVLQINPVLVFHSSFSMHLEIGWTEDSVFFELERVFLTAARVKRDDRPSLHLRNNMLEDVFSIVVGIPDNRRYRKLKLRHHLFEQGDGDFFSSRSAGWVTS